MRSGTYGKEISLTLRRIRHIKSEAIPAGGMVPLEVKLLFTGSREDGAELIGRTIDHAVLVGRSGFGIGDLGTLVDGTRLHFFKCLRDRLFGRRIRPVGIIFVDDIHDLDRKSVV